MDRLLFILAIASFPLPAPCPRQGNRRHHRSHAESDYYSRPIVAPLFRTLSQRYEIDGLAEALAEGISVGHPDMPEFTFEAEDAGAILAYLKSIQER
jgi:hypothetical protein